MVPAFGGRIRWRKWHFRRGVPVTPQQLGMSKAGTGTKRPPPVKVLSGQLRTAEPCGDSYSVRLDKGRALPVSLVWMQGTVLEVQPNMDSALLLDETGTFTVQGVRAIPKGKPCLSQGTGASAKTLPRVHTCGVCGTLPGQKWRFWQLLRDMSSERRGNAHS